MNVFTKTLSISAKLFALLMVLFMVQACQKEGCTNPRAANYDSKADKDDGSCIIYGCTDPDATNYDPTATASDNSCIYPEGDGVFWTDADYGHGYISCYVEGSYVGQITSFYGAYDPDCWDSGCATFTRDPGTYDFYAEADDGTWWSSTITIYSGNCSKMRLYGKKQMEVTYCLPIE